jgi:type IV secretory pathway VirJ component
VRRALAIVAFATGVSAVAATPKLPIVVHPSTRGNSDTLAILLTGDGGWRHIDIRISEELGKEGIPVIGLLSNKYFTPRRTADESAVDLERLIVSYSAAWKKSRVILIGYSRGADVLPFLVNRLPATTRARIAAVALLGLESTIDFKYHPSWIPFYHPREPQFSVRPEVEKLRGLNIVCVYGEKEKDTLCPSLPADLAHVVRMPGAHHFGGRYVDVTRAILRVANGD